MLEVEKLKFEPSPFVKAAEIIRKGEVYQGMFKSEQAADIMSGFVLFIVKNHGAIKASVLKMDMGIKRTTGTIAGTVIVERPAKVKIDLNCSLDNDTDQGKIKLSKLNIVTDAKGVTGFVLNKAKVLEKTRRDLQKPNEAFMRYLVTEFDPMGITLNELGLEFREGALMVSLKGQAPEQN